MPNDCILGKKYHLDRETKRSLRYRYRRRSDEVANIIREYNADIQNSEPIRLLDVGSADGLMLTRLKNNFPDIFCVGLEYSIELIQENKVPHLNIMQGDTHFLNFKNYTFDIVSACAIIEHLHNPDAFLEECNRVLKNNGILIITTPVPFWENIFKKIGHLDEDLHYNTFTLKQLKQLLNNHGYKIKKCQKFMMSPFGFPYEIFFEKIMKYFYLTFTLGNQIVVGKK